MVADARQHFTQECFRVAPVEFRRADQRDAGTKSSLATRLPGGLPFHFLHPEHMRNMFPHGYNTSHDPSAQLRVPGEAPQASMANMHLCTASNPPTPAPSSFSEDSYGFDGEHQADPIFGFGQHDLSQFTQNAWENPNLTETPAPIIRIEPPQDDRQSQAEAAPQQSSDPARSSEDWVHVPGLADHYSHIREINPHLGYGEASALQEFDVLFSLLSGQRTRTHRQPQVDPLAPQRSGRVAKPEVRHATSPARPESAYSPLTNTGTPKSTSGVRSPLRQVENNE
jgi:hypothetical protein